MNVDEWFADNWDRLKLLLPAAGIPVIAISGCQGSGKSRLADHIARTIKTNSLVLSLDDYYLSKAERTQLARDVHPILGIRGVPGTHQIELLHKSLLAAKTRTRPPQERLPRFDKITDDIAPKSEWPKWPKRVDLVILEGWCIGATPQGGEEIAQPINQLEALQDPDGVWRTYVNDALKSVYADCFEMIDLHIHMNAPGFSVVHKWRLEQELSTYARCQTPPPPTLSEQILAFIEPYERLTRHMMADSEADVSVHLDEDRKVTHAEYSA